MIRVLKSSEPKELLEHRSKKHATYDNLTMETKTIIKQNLLKDQGHICCYCMDRITLDKSTIEHFQCKARHPKKQLDYANLYAVCLGNPGMSTDQHCDESKGDKELSLRSLTDDSIDSEVKYYRHGGIYSDNHKLHIDMNDTLNLNYSRLVDNRKHILDALFKDIYRNYQANKVKKQYLIKKLELVRNKQGGIYTPYCGIVVYWLEKKLKQIS